MRKFLSTIAYLVITIVLVVVGIMGIIGLTGNNEPLIKWADESLNPNGALMVALTVGGIGGAIGTGVLTIANFFKQKTRSV